MTTKERELSHSEQQAKSQLEGIKSMVAALDLDSATPEGDWREFADRFDLVPKGDKNRDEGHWLAVIKKAIEDGELNADRVREQAIQTIQEHPLCVEIRSGWYTLDADDDAKKPAEYNILLCTGGPACRIIGGLSEHGEPSTARIEHQDWGTPWTEYRISSEDEEIVLTYCRQFYFGG